MNGHSGKTHMRLASTRQQRGATLIIGLIMIVLITLIVVNAFTLSSSNLKSVGNMQIRDEAIAAANEAAERLISTDFTVALGTQTFTVDIDKNGTTDYTVALAKPTCIREKVSRTTPPSDFDQPGLTSASWWNTDWDIDTTVTDAASGASVRIRQGVRVLVFNSGCPA